MSKSYSMFLCPSITVDQTTGRLIINSERTYYGQTERLLSGDSHYAILETEDKIRRLHGIPSIFA